MHVSRLTLVFLAGCVLDNEIGDVTKPDPFSDPDPDPTPGDTDTGDSASGTDTDTAEPVVECLPVDPGSAGTVAIVDACDAEAPPEVPDPWDITVELYHQTVGSGVIVMPAVGNLTDDNDDGLVN